MPQRPLEGIGDRAGLVPRTLASYVPSWYPLVTFQQELQEQPLMKAAFLPDRGVVKVSGEDARNFVNGLVTTDLTPLRPGLGRFGALLTPQGKITVDFL